MAATLIGFTGIDVRAQTPDELSLPSLWDTVCTLRSGFGYKDNVFLSHSRQQDAAFISGGGDVMVIRLAPVGPQYNFFASADASHFFSTSPSHNEYTVFAQAQVENDFGNSFTGTLAAEYFYQDQAVDASFLDDAAPVPALVMRSETVRGHTATLRPSVRWNLPGQFWLTLETPVTCQIFDEPLDDYWMAGAKLTLGRTYGHASRLSVSYEPTWRFYQHDEELTAIGTPIPGTERERFQQDAVFTWRHHWDAAKCWRTTLKLGGRITDENGAGYSNFTQGSAAAQVLYRRGGWEIFAEGRVRQYDYRTQTVSLADQSKLRRTEWLAAFGIERQLTKRLKFIANYEHEKISSNDDLESYSVNTVSGTLQFEF